MCHEIAPDIIRHPIVYMTVFLIGAMSIVALNFYFPNPKSIPDPLPLRTVFSRKDVIYERISNDAAPKGFVSPDHITIARVKPEYVHLNRSGFDQEKYISSCEPRHRSRRDSSGHYVFVPNMWEEDGYQGAFRCAPDNSTVFICKRACVYTM